MKDKNDLKVQIEVIRGDDAYAGMLEGTPYLARKMRLLQGRERMKRAGEYVDGLDDLEREISGMQRDYEIWAPNERWSARLITPIDWASHRRHYLVISWYQQGGDPLSRLAAIVSGLDFMQYCNEEAVEPD